MLNKKVLLFGIIISFLLLSAFWLFKPEVCTATSDCSYAGNSYEQFAWPTYHRFINDSSHNITISRSYIAYSKRFISYRDANWSETASSENYELQTAEETLVQLLLPKEDALS